MESHKKAVHSLRLLISEGASTQTPSRRVLKARRADSCCFRDGHETEALSPSTACATPEKEAGVSPRASNGALSPQAKVELAKQPAEWRGGSGTAERLYVNLSELDKIIAIDLSSLTLDIEPGVTMQQAVTFLMQPSIYTSKLNERSMAVADVMMPPVVTEFKHMTYVGAVLGLGAESSSFDYGFIHESVLEYELLDLAGRIHTISKYSHTDGPNLVASLECGCTADRHAELFHTLPGSYGTLGMVTRMRIQCVLRKRHVQLSYLWVPSLDRVIEEMLRHDKKGKCQSEHEGSDVTTIDFIDAVCVSEREFCVMTGHCINIEDISYITRFTTTLHLSSSFSQWFYNRILASKPQRDKYPHTPGPQQRYCEQDILSLPDYYFRWDRGAFFNASMRLTHSWFNRLVYGPHLTSKALYRRARRRSIAERESQKMNQDMMVPITRLKEFFHINANTHGCFPLWMLPMRSNCTKGMFTFPSTESMFVNIGAYGQSRCQPFNFVTENRKLEKFIRSPPCPGLKCFWNQGYMSEDEFWSQTPRYNKNRYDQLRREYGTDEDNATVYDKVCGMYKSFLSLDTVVEAHRRRIDEAAIIPEGSSAYSSELLVVDPVKMIAHTDSTISSSRLIRECHKYNLVPLSLPNDTRLTVSEGHTATALFTSNSFRHDRHQDRDAIDFNNCLPSSTPAFCRVRLEPSSQYVMIRIRVFEGYQHAVEAFLAIQERFHGERAEKKEIGERGPGPHFMEMVLSPTGRAALVEAVYTNRDPTVDLFTLRTGQYLAFIEKLVSKAINDTHKSAMYGDRVDGSHLFEMRGQMETISFLHRFASPQGDGVQLRLDKAERTANNLALVRCLIVLISKRIRWLASNLVESGFFQTAQSPCSKIWTEVVLPAWEVVQRNPWWRCIQRATDNVTVWVLRFLQERLMHMASLLVVFNVMSSSKVVSAWRESILHPWVRRIDLIIAALRSDLPCTSEGTFISPDFGSQLVTTADSYRDEFSKVRRSGRIVTAGFATCVGPGTLHVVRTETVDQGGGF
eukprot:GHVN01096849.1.p1 GENE.GHVN01096849.1~~GHVN01096849.1.p1  ORF type:complete len:1027 (-),score=118.00 GHVN01096849.1:677-3757(-)